MPEVVDEVPPRMAFPDKKEFYEACEKGKAVKLNPDEITSYSTLKARARRTANKFKKAKYHINKRGDCFYVWWE